jgi:5-methylcytosine-specific restriction endonuclease McrA
MFALALNADRLIGIRIEKMGKNPAFQFYPNDWLRDTITLSPQAKGGWIDLLAKMHYNTPRGQICDNYTGYARLFGCDKHTAKKIIDELRKKGICEYVTNGGGCVTLVCRRMENEEAIKESARKRKAKQRELGGGDPKNWIAIRAKILERDNYKCQYCNKKANTVDHIFPRSRGGSEALSNLVAACKGCNFKKTNKTLEEANMAFWAVKINKSHTPENHVCQAIDTTENKSHKKVISLSSSSKDSSSKDTTTKTKNTCAGFDHFWQEYPRKKSKGQAEKAWEKIKPNKALLATMIDKIKQAKNSNEWTKENGQFIPYPATWLNAKGWEDEYTTKPQRDTSHLDHISED